MNREVGGNPGAGPQRLSVPSASDSLAVCCNCFQKLTKAEQEGAWGLYPSIHVLCECGSIADFAYREAA